MTPIDFLLNLLVFILGTTISLLISAFLGFLFLKRLIGKAMESKEIKEFKAGLDAVTRELERLKDRFDKLLNSGSGGYVA